LAFLSGIFFFFLILRSAWWLVPGVLTWTAIFVWQDRRERQRDRAAGIPGRSEGYDPGGARRISPEEGLADLRNTEGR
jgi:4-hydroxybenzoate polyprenyltransferase